MIKQRIQSGQPTYQRTSLTDNGWDERLEKEVIIKCDGCCSNKISKVSML